MKKMTYKKAGVDDNMAAAFVDKIKNLADQTHDSYVKGELGGFAALYAKEDSFLVSGTDGVGTKLKIAQMLNIHHTIGIDLVAMCSNDVLCTGAKNLFFLDYLAVSGMNLEVSEDIIKGIVQGCKKAKASLIGGETAQMPDMYKPGEYDLAGFMVGEVKKKDLIHGKNICEGDVLIGIPSSGFHSNGFSLIRKLVKKEETELLTSLLTPTRIYTSLMEDLLMHHRSSIKGIAHITGGGWKNIARVNEGFDYIIDNLPRELPFPMTEVIERSGLANDELWKVFNMGVGMVLVTDSPDKVMNHLARREEKCWRMGRVVSGSGNVAIDSKR